MNLRRIETLVDSLAVQAGLALGPKAYCEISIVLASTVGIRRVNRRFLHSDDVTDVISFEYAQLPGTENLRTGDVIVNVELAAKLGPEHGGASRELALYIAHGLDHLSGSNDATKTGFTAMRRRELGWLRKADAAGLLNGLVSGRTRRAGSRN